MEEADDNIETIAEQTVEPIEVFVNHGMLTIENTFAVLGFRP